MQICFNGGFHPSTQPVIRTVNRAYRYGDGLFETILLSKGEMPLFSYHMRRLYAGVALLGYRFPLEEADLLQQIKTLCKKNNCEERARIRIVVTGGNGFINEEREKADYLIEAREMNLAPGQAQISNLGLYPGAFKSRDALSNLKSSSALIYAQAAAYGRSQGLDDVLVMNSEKRLADSTIANVFVVTDNGILTPSLSEGCVDGVMRRWLLEQFGAEMNITEGEIAASRLEGAREIFLTNALRGLIQVKRYLGRELAQEISTSMRENSVQTLGEGIC
jgi:branched-chain amino acid aminotransferase